MFGSQTSFSGSRKRRRTAGLNAGTLDTAPHSKLAFHFQSVKEVSIEDFYRFHLFPHSTSPYISKSLLPLQGILPLTPPFPGETIREGKLLATGPASYPSNDLVDVPVRG